MNVIELIERRSNRAFAEAMGLTLIEDLPADEQKSIEDDMELKVRYVRTPAGVRRFKQPIGTVITNKGGLGRIRILNPVYRDWDLFEDRKGKKYDVGKDDDGKYRAYGHNDWDDMVAEGDTMDDVLDNLNDSLGGGTTDKMSDEEAGTTPTPKKRPVPKTPEPEPEADDATDEAPGQVDREARQKRIDEYRKDPFGDRDAPKHPNRMKTPSKRQWEELDKLNDDQFEDFLEAHYTEGDSVTDAIKNVGGSGGGAEAPSESPAAAKAREQGLGIRNEMTATNGRIDAHEKNMRDELAKGGTRGERNAMRRHGNLITEIEDQTRAAKTLKRNQATPQDVKDMMDLVIESEKSRKDRAIKARDAATKAKTPDAPAKKGGWADGLTPAQVDAVTKLNPQHTATYMGARNRGLSHYQAFDEISGSGTATAPKKVPDAPAKKGRKVPSEGMGNNIGGGTVGQEYPLSTMDHVREAGGRKSFLDLHHATSSARKATKDQLMDLTDDEFIAAVNDIERNGTGPAAAVRKHKGTGSSNTPAPEARERRIDGSGGPRGATSIGSPGTPERDAFIEGHSKLKDVSDYHKPKLRDLNDKNFQAYVDAVDGGKSPNGIGAIMDRVAPGISWNPETEKWSGQEGRRRRPVPVGDTSASDAADRATRDRVESMRRQGRSEGRTNPFTSSLTPAQKREVDALTPGEYARYMNARDGGVNHRQAHGLAKENSSSRRQAPTGPSGGPAVSNEDREADRAIDYAENAMQKARELRQGPNDQQNISRYRSALEGLEEASERLRLSERGLSEDVKRAHSGKRDDVNSLRQTLRDRIRGFESNLEESQRVDEEMRSRRREREAAETQSQKFGNNNQMVASNDDHLKAIVDAGRAGNAEPLRQETQERLAEIDKRLQDDDRTLGGYGLGKGGAEADRSGAQIRERLTAQQGRFRQAIEIMDRQRDGSGRQSTPTPASSNRDTGPDVYGGLTQDQQAEANSLNDTQHADYAKWRKQKRTHNVAMEAARSGKSPRGSKARRIEDMMEERRRTAESARRDAERASRQRATPGQDNERVQLTGTPQSDNGETMRMHERANDANRPFRRLRNQFDTNFRLLQENSNEPDRIRNNRLNSLRKSIADRESRLADPQLSGDLLERHVRAQRRAIEADKERLAQVEGQSQSTSSDASDPLSNESLRNASQLDARAWEAMNQALTDLDYGDDSEAAQRRMNEVSQMAQEADEARNALNRHLRDTGQILTPEQRRLLGDQRSGHGSQSMRDLFERRRRMTQNRQAPIIREERTRRLRDAETAGDTDTAIALTRELEAEELSRALGQSSKRQEIQRRWNDRRRNIERNKSRQTQAPAGQSTAPERVSNTPQERAVRPAGQSEGTRLPSVDSTVQRARTEISKARRARSQSSIRDRQNDLRNSRRTLERDLSRSGDRMTADQHAEVQDTISAIDRTMADAERKLPLDSRTRFDARDLPALRERANQNRDYREVARNQATSEALGVFDSLPTSIPDGTTYGPQVLDTDALANMEGAPSVSALNRAIRDLEAQEDTTVDDEIRVLREARDYLKERADRDRAEFDAANTSLFGDDFSIPERTAPAGQMDRTDKTPIDIGMFGVRSESEARQMYANTPRRSASEIPKGGNGHIGNGIWLKRCPVCGQGFKSVGSPGYSSTYARHEASHGGQVAGYNAPML